MAGDKKSLITSINQIVQELKSKSADLARDPEHISAVDLELIGASTRYLLEHIQVLQGLVANHPVTASPGLSPPSVAASAPADLKIEPSLHIPANEVKQPQSLNDRLAHQNTVTSAVTRNNKEAPKTNSVATLNERLLFVRILFNGDARAYERTLAALHGLPDQVQVESSIQDLGAKLNWTGKEAEADQFLTMVLRRFL